MLSSKISLNLSTNQAVYKKLSP